MKKKIIILTCILLSILVIVIYCYNNDYYTFKGHEFRVPRPDNTKTIIYHGGIDQTAFQIMEYNSKDIKKIIRQGFKKINLEEINEIYKKTIEESIFRWYLNEDEKQIFLKNFDKEKLFNTNNYYLFYEDTEEPVYEFMLFIVDMKENKLYYIISA